MSTKKEFTVEFAPGCFDSFDGTQEELDEMIAEIRQMIDSGELFDKAEPIDLEAMLEDDDPEERAFAQRVIDSDQAPTRNLQ